MKIQAFILLTLVLMVSAERRRYRARMTMPPPEGGCSMVQPFDQDFVYTYKYVAYTEHMDLDMGTGNSVRMTCTATITVPRRCSGMLRVSDCQLDQGKKSIDGQVAYRRLPGSAKFAREMEVSEMAFHFNGGQITRIFVDKQERTNVTNFKRGILSSLQAFNPEIPRGVEVGDTFELPEINVYGKGIVTHSIVEKVGSLPSTIDIIRDNARIELPWERRQWNFIRMRNNDINPLLSAFKNYITLTNEERWAKPIQVCRYQLNRGRLVSMAQCEERFSLNPTKPEIAASMFESSRIETVVRQEITLKSPRRMTQADRSQWDVTRFDEESIMFEEEWEETNMAYTTGFDAKMAFMKLIREPMDDKSPAMISKLSRWLAVSSQEDIESVWAKCERECSEQEKSDGRILWVELLNSCISNDFCQIPYCPSENATTCLGAMETFVSRNHDKSEEIREACMSSLEYIRSPSVHIIQTTLTMCRSDERTSPACVHTLGVLLRNFYETCGNDCENKKPVEDSKKFLTRQLKRNCDTKSLETEELMAVSIESIGRLGVNGRYAEDTLLTCAVNSDAPVRVAVKALVAYDNITEETLSETASNKFLQMFQARETPIEIRITCFHLLMKKHLAESMVERILTTVMDEEEHPLLIDHCRKDLRIQLMLRGTMFSQCHPEVAKSCVKIILRNHYDIGLPRESLTNEPKEKEFSMKREMWIPYLDARTNCTIKVVSVFEKENSIFPIMSKLVAYATVEGKNVTLIEAAVDIAGMKPILDRIFGHNNFYAEIFSKFLKTPIQELHGYSKQYPALNGLMEEGKWSYIRDIFEIRSPVYLKVMGYEINFDSLMSSDTFRRFTLGNVLEMIESLERGFEHKAFIAGQPILMQHATPTSIGAPMTSTIDMSYIIKNTLSLRANFRKMLFSPNEKAVANIVPELFLTATVRRSILEKFTESSGTEFVFKIGHGSSVSCSMDAQPSGWGLVCTPKEGKSRLLHVSGKFSLASDAIREPSASVCKAYSIRSMCTFTLCKQPDSETGFAYEVDFDNHFDTEFRGVMQYKAEPEERTRNMRKQWEMEWSAEKRSNPSTKKVIFSTVVDFVPERKELGLQIDGEFFRWRGAANLMFPMYESKRGLFASFNSSGKEDMEYKYFNVFRVNPVAEKRYNLEGKSSWVVGEETHGYTIRGDAFEAPEGENKTRSMHLELFKIGRQEQPELRYEILMKKVPRAMQNMQGYEVFSSLTGPMLPWHKKYDYVMVSYDNGKQYEQILKLSGHWQNEERNPHFYIHRARGSVKELESEAYSAEIYCVSNYFQTAFVANSDAKGDKVHRAKLNMPETPIRYNDIVRQENPFTYNVDTYSKPVASFVEYNFTTTIMEREDRQYEMGLGWRLWSYLYREYQYDKATIKYVNYRECSYCHFMEIQHPKLLMRSESRRDESRNMFHEEKWLKVHHSLMSYLRIRPDISYYLIKNMRNGWLEVGWKAIGERAGESDSTNKLEFVFLRNTANCTLRLMTNEVNSKCTINTELIPFKADMRVDYKKSDEDASEINVFYDAKYTDVGCRMNGLFKLMRSNEFTSSWNASYGSYPEFEYADQLYLSFDNVQSTYQLKGEYETLYKPSETKRVYKYLGSSRRISGGTRDLEINVMCPESKTECGKFLLNKNGKIALVERYVYGDKYDRATITQEDNVYKMEMEFASKFMFGMNKAALIVESGNTRYGFKLESRICNVSGLYSDETGIEIKSAINTPQIQHEFIATADAASARYNFMWERLGYEGARTESNMTLRFAIFDEDEPVDMAISMGLGPKAMQLGIQIPSFEWVFARSADHDKTPMRFEYFFDGEIAQRKHMFIINRMQMPLRETYVEIKNTKMGFEYPDPRNPEMFVRDIELNILPKCSRESTSMKITGNLEVSYDKLVMKLSSSDRSFVFDVDVRRDTPMKHHIEFMVEMMRTKLELLWDMKTVNDKLTTTGKCEVSFMHWNERELTPVFSIISKKAFGKTPETGNFPEITIDVTMTHSLPVPFIPKEYKMLLTTTSSGMTTKLHSLSEFGKARMMETTIKMVGCHKRIEIATGYSMCVPNSMSSNVTEVFPSLRGELISSMIYEDNRWTYQATYKLLVPAVSETPIVSTARANVVVTPCNTESWCVPRRIEVRDVESHVPETMDMVLKYFTPKMLHRFNFSGFHLRNSEIIFSRDVVGQYKINKLRSILRRDDNAEEIEATITATFSPNKLGYVIDITDGEVTIKHKVETTCSDPTNIQSPWEYHYLLESPWMTTSTDIRSSSLLSITDCEIKMKMPGGLIRDFSFSYGDNRLSYDLDLKTRRATGKSTNVISWNPSTGSWEANSMMDCPWIKFNFEGNGRKYWVNNCNMKFESMGFLNKFNVVLDNARFDAVGEVGSFEFDVKNTADDYTWNIKSWRYPWMNQTWVMSKDEREGMMNYHSRYETPYHTCTFKFNSRSWRVKVKEIDCRMKNSEAAFKVEYVDEDEGCRCRIMAKTDDNARFSCLSTPLSSERSEGRLECSKLEGTQRIQFVSMPVKMRDFPFMGDYLIRDKALFLWRSVENIRRIANHDERYMLEHYKRDQWCMNKTICQEVAMRFKSTYYTWLREIYRVAGPSMYYAIKPDTTEYTLLDSMMSAPGMTEMLPKWSVANENSPIVMWKRFLQGQNVTLGHFEFGKYLKYELTVNVDEEGTYYLTVKFNSDKFEWLNGLGSVSMKTIDDQTIVNVTEIASGWKYIGIFALHGGKLNLVASESGKEGRDKKIITTYEWNANPTGRHNISVMMMNRGVVGFVCDMLTEPQDWSNTVVKCYEGRRRQHEIASFTVPDISTLLSREATDFDEILRDVLHIQSFEHRNKVKNAWRSWLTSDSNSDRSQGWKYDMLHRSADYVLASFYHETAKYVSNVEDWNLWWDNLWNFDFLTNWMRWDWLMDWSSSDWWRSMLMDFSPSNWWMNLLRSDWWRSNWRMDLWRSDSWMSTWPELVERARPLWQAGWKTFKYVMDGDMTAEYKFEDDDALIIKLSVNSSRYPLATFNTTIRVTRPSFEYTILNITSSNKFLRLWANVVLDGPRVAIEKLGAALPDGSRQSFEMRLVSDPDPRKPYFIETYFADIDGQYYGCRGIRGSFESPILHMHCYVLEGTEFPINPPSSKMFSHYDIPCGPRCPVARIVLSSDFIEGIVQPCLGDPETILKEKYHIFDKSILQRLTRTIEHNCQYWKNLFEVDTPRSDWRYDMQTEQSTRNTFVSLAKEYKISSRDKWWSSASNIAKLPTFEKIPEFRLGFIADLVFAIYEFTWPSTRYAFAAMKYVQPEGMLKVSTCTECLLYNREIEVQHSFKSNRFPVLDQEQAMIVSSQGMINTSIINTLAWGWIEWKMNEVIMLPMARKGKFGLRKSGEGVEILVRPQMASGERPLMAACFEASGRHCCNIRMETLMTAQMTCYPMTHSQMSSVATCEMSPVGMLSTSGALVVGAMVGNVPTPTQVTRVLEKTCQFRNDAFKDAVTNSISKDLDFFGHYWRNFFKDVVKAISDLFKLSYSTWWNSVVETYYWLCDIIPNIRRMDIHKYFFAAQEMVESALIWFEEVAKSIDETNKWLYDILYFFNKFAYDSPSYVPLLWHSETAPHYYQDWANYISDVGSNLWTVPNCVCGMIHRRDAEQVVSLNNHMYNLPRKIRKCSYLLAAKSIDHHNYRVLLMRNDLVINLEDITITIDPDMRVYEGQKGRNGRPEVPLPYFNRDMYCERTETRLTCYTNSMTVVVHSENNVRTGFLIKFASSYCPRTIGLMGLGANTTVVPPMPFSDGTAASSMKAFLDHYAIEQSCSIGPIPTPPGVSHQYCDALFNKEQWMASCPMRRRSWMKACQTSARSEEEACEYAKRYNKMCHMEGRATRFAPSCEICKGNTEMKNSINKVQLTVVLSLSRKTNRDTLPEILNAIRKMANQKHVNYEVSFVTFGGRDEMYAPEFHAINGKVTVPSTDEWTLPSVEFNGPIPMYETLRTTMWYAYMNTKTTVEGVGKTFLFVVPEDMDLTYLETSTVADFMNKDMTKSYLLIPNTCQVRGAKMTARFGVRPLFTTQPTNICMPTPESIASTIEYPFINRRVSCTCKVLNIFNGASTDECQLAP